VAAIWLEVDEKTLRKYLSAGLIPYMQVMSRRRIEVSALVEFEKRNMIRSTVGARR
jgi:predicted site-specific integrase-resolvase